jgi:hypothetical protein
LHTLVPRTGLQLPAHLPYAKWLNIGKQLCLVTDSSAWCLGDWLVYGKKSYPGRYRDVIEQTSLDYQTLRNYAWIAKRVPLARRRADLSFGHHAEVAALPAAEQDFWLRKAAEHAWPRNQLRREIRHSLKERNEPDPEAGDDGPPSEADRRSRPASQNRIELTPTPEQMAAWTEAASRSGVDVAEWAVAQLDQVASQHRRPHTELVPVVSPDVLATALSDPRVPGLRLDLCGARSGQAGLPCPAGGTS